MRWQGRRESTNVEDRRSVAGPVAVGGGIQRCVPQIGSLQQPQPVVDGVLPGEAGEFLRRNRACVIETRDKIDRLFREGLDFTQVVEQLRGEILQQAHANTAQHGFLCDTWLRRMLRTGLMGYMADILQYDVEPALRRWAPVFQAVTAEPAASAEATA
jgi:hypothetical protein